MMGDGGGQKWMKSEFRLFNAESAINNLESLCSILVFASTQVIEMILEAGINTTFELVSCSQL